MFVGNLKPTKTNGKTNTTNNNQRTTHTYNYLFINFLIYYSIEKFRALLVCWFVGRGFVQYFSKLSDNPFPFIWGSSGVWIGEQKSTTGNDDA